MRLDFKRWVLWIWFVPRFLMFWISILLIGTIAWALYLAWAAFLVFFGLGGIFLLASGNDWIILLWLGALAGWGLTFYLDKVKFGDKIENRFNTLFQKLEPKYPSKNQKGGE